jgi:hypothetical protein
VPAAPEVPAVPVVPAVPLVPAVPVELLSLPQPTPIAPEAATAATRNAGIKSFFNISMLLFEVGREGFKPENCADHSPKRKKMKKKRKKDDESRKALYEPAANRHATAGGSPPGEPPVGPG